MRHPVKRIAAILVVALLTTISIGATLAWAQTESSESDGSSSRVTEQSIADLSLEEYSHARAALMTGSIQETFITQNFPNIENLLFKNNTDAAVAVSTAKADFTIVPRIVAKQLVDQYSNLKMSSIPTFAAPVSFVMKKGSTNTKLFQELSDFITSLTDDGTLDKLEKIWFGEDEEQKVMDDPTLLPNINGVIHIMTRSDNEPYNYMRNGVLVGYELDIIGRFAKEYGYAVEFQVTEFDSLILSVETGKADLVAGNMSKTPERAEAVDFLPPLSYSYSHVVYNDTFFDGGSTAVAQQNALVSSFVKTFLTENRWQLIASGLGVTLLIAFGSAVFGTALGCCLALGRRYCGRKVNRVIDLYVRLFQGTPILVMLLIFYYVIFGNAEISAVIVAIITFSLNFAAFFSESFSSCLAAVDPGQREAALSSGFSERGAFLHFILPVALRHVIPIYRGELISLLKSTSIVGYVAIVDMTKAGDIIRSRTYEALFPLLTIAILYLLIALLIAVILGLVEKKILRDRPKKSIRGVTLH